MHHFTTFPIFIQSSGNREEGVARDDPKGDERVDAVSRSQHRPTFDLEAVGPHRGHSGPAFGRNICHSRNFSDNVSNNNVNDHNNNNRNNHHNHNDVNNSNKCNFNNKLNIGPVEES